MAVNNPSGLTLLTQTVGQKYTKVTDSSTDWASVSNDTYFYDLATGLVYYKNTDGVVLSPYSESNPNQFTINCRNQSGLDMYKGSIVYIDSSTGNKPTIELAQANSEASSSRTVGVLKEDIDNNADGLVVTIGSITDLDTRNVAIHPFTTDVLLDGDTLYLSPYNAGYITNVKPYAPNHLVYIGVVVRTSPTNGYIEYQIQNGYELQELHNVQILTTPTNNEALIYDSTSNLWKPSFIPLINSNDTFRGRTFRVDNTTVDTYGGIDTLNNASTLAQILGSTSFYQRFTRLRYYASIVATGRQTDIRGIDLQWYRSSGFRFVTTFRVADTAISSNPQQFYGLAGYTTQLPYGTASLIQLSTLVNLIGVGSEAIDTNLQVFHNDGTGTCTKIDLGVGFPANRTAGDLMTTMYSIEIYNGNLETDVKYRVKNLETGEVAQGIITTNLPSTSQGLTIFASRCMGTAITNTGQFELNRWGCYDVMY
jgi:hypothetical protein